MRSIVSLGRQNGMAVFGADHRLQWVGSCLPPRSPRAETGQKLPVDNHRHIAHNT